MNAGCQVRRSSTQPLDLVEALVQAARVAGGDDAEAFYVEQSTTTVEMRDGALETVIAAGTRGVGLRVLVGDAFGYAYSTELDTDGQAELVQRAIRLARVATPDPDRVLPDRQDVPDEDLQIFDEGLGDITLDAKIALLGRLETAARETDARVRQTDFARYTDAVGTCAIASTRGIADAARVTACYLALSVIARENGQSQRGFGVTAGRRLADLDVEGAGQRAATRAVAPLGGTPVPTQRASVVLDPEIVAEWLRGVAQALYGDAIVKGRSFLVGRLGERIGSPLVTLVDDGRRLGGYASAPFDGEGVPTQETMLLDDGVLRGHLHTTYTARRAGVRSTGNAIRPSYRALPDVGPTNLILRPGSTTREDLIRGVDRGLYVVATRNVGGINPVSGDYSVGASGRWIERGELAGPVTGVTIAAPMLEMLANVTAVGSDLRWVPGQAMVGAPTIRIDDVTIGGR